MDNISESVTLNPHSNTDGISYLRFARTTNHFGRLVVTRLVEESLLPRPHAQLKIGPKHTGGYQ